MTVTPPTIPLSFSSWLLAGLSHSGLCTNIYISEDLCRSPEADSPNPWGSVEHRLRTTALAYLQSVDVNLISVGRRIEHAKVDSLAMKTLPGKALQKCLHTTLQLNLSRVYVEAN